jgi:hypothetical protein
VEILSGNVLKANTINETTAGSGVTIDGSLLKDTTVKTDHVYTDQISQSDGGLGVTCNQTLKVNNIQERTTSNGVSIEDLGIVDDGINGLGTITTTDLSIGNTSAAADAIVRLQSKQDMVLFIESDTDNTTESDNPSLALSQDGNAICCQIGIQETNNSCYIDIGAISGFSPALIFRTGGSYVSAPSTGVVPTFTTPPTQAMSISGSSQYVDFDVGCTFATAGGTASLLNYYEEYDYNATFEHTTDSGVNEDLQIYLTRIGKMVTCVVSAKTSCTPSSAGYWLNQTDVLPSRFRPIIELNNAIVIGNTGTAASSVATIQTDGVIKIWGSVGFGNFGTVGVNLWRTTSWSWSV